MLRTPQLCLALQFILESNPWSYSVPSPWGQRHGAPFCWEAPAPALQPGSSSGHGGEDRGAARAREWRVRVPVVGVSHLPQRGVTPTPQRPCVPLLCEGFLPTQ